MIKNMYKGGDFMIYLDYAANTPCNPDVLNTYVEITQKYFANPNASYLLGYECANLIDVASTHIKDHFKQEEIIYTSGASEANNLALKGIASRYKNRGKHIIIGALEHNSITAIAMTLVQNGYQVEVAPINMDGLIDLNKLNAMIRDDTILVSIAAVDSELGVVQPIDEIAKLCHQRSHCYYHCDASQAVGKVDLDYSNVDLLTITPHKFYGLNNIGALLKKQNVGLVAQIEGGNSTSMYRSGTPMTNAILAFDKAVEKLKEINQEIIQKHHQNLIEFFKSYPDIQMNSTKASCPHIINISIEGVLGNPMMEKLADHEIYVSTKSSCCPRNKPSKSIYALTKSKARANSSLRISLSHLTCDEEIEQFKQTFDQIYKEVKYGEI